MKSYPSWLSNIPATWWRRGMIILGSLLVLASLPIVIPAIERLADGIAGSAPAETTEPKHEGEDHHEHAPSITLSDAARANINLQFEIVKPEAEPFPRYITVPAIVTERPGESRYKVVAPFTGIVMGMNIVPGQLVDSSDLLFTLRLTHEDLVNAQKEFLQTLGQLDVEGRELERLKQINASVMARKVILDKEYVIETLQASLSAQKHALELHGLSTGQISQIETQRMLVREVKISVPFLHQDASVHGDAESNPDAKASNKEDSHPLVRQEFLVQHLDVNAGDAVVTGQTLCDLVDYQKLFIEGRAFEQDAQSISDAATDKLGVDAIPEGRYAETSDLKSLSIVRIANEIETDSRALHFYVELNNTMEHQTQRGNRQFATWRYKPGQRMQLRIPVDVFHDVIVLPVEAVADEGLETYVFVENGKRLERRSVHVLHRDQVHAVIANDGSLFPSESVAKNAAHQLLMALKAQSGGGGGDPHAGHMH